MTDNETTPEYGAWVDANRTAVEAQRADLEAAPGAGGLRWGKLLT